MPALILKVKESEAQAFSRSSDPPKALILPSDPALIGYHLASQIWASAHSNESVRGSDLAALPQLFQRPEWLCAPALAAARADGDVSRELRL